jgi:hypothetical protein
MIDKHYVIICNKCYAFVVYDKVGHARTVMNVAKATGWHHDKYSSLCPNCNHESSTYNKTETKDHVVKLQDNTLLPILSEKIESLESDLVAVTEERDLLRKVAGSVTKQGTGYDCERLEIPCELSYTKDCGSDECIELHIAKVKEGG